MTKKITKRQRICVVKKMHKLKREGNQNRSQRIAIALKTCGVSKSK